MEKTKKEPTRVQKAQDIAINEGGIEYVIDVFDTPNFVEVIGRTGGDTRTIRVMNDGQFYER